MSIRRTEIQKLKTGQYIMVDEEPCIIKATERSKSGKHGHANWTCKVLHIQANIM